YYTKIPSLNLLPNFWGNNTITIRGVSTGAFSNPTVGVMVDDVTYSGSTGALGNESPDFDPSDLARVEALRGPQGTFYGANSMGGLLKFVTVDPSTAALTGRVQTSTEHVHDGGKPGFNVRGAVNIPITDTLAVRASGMRREDPGYIDNPRT